MEVGPPDDDGELEAYEPTAAELTTDRELAIQTVIAALTGIAIVAGVYVGAAATAFGPIALALAHAAVRRIGQRRIDNATDTLMDAAEDADATVTEFLEQAASDPHRQELLVRVLSAAQDAAWPRKRRALSRALPTESWAT